MATRIRKNGSNSPVHQFLTGAHQISEYLNNACERAGVSLPLARALQCLADSDEPVTPTEVSRELGRSPAATSELVKRLVNSGWITADLDPSDRRSFQLVLTGSGRAKFNGVSAVLDQAEVAITRSYGKRKLIDLASSVDSLVEQISGARIQG